MRKAPPTRLRSYRCYTVLGQTRKMREAASRLYPSSPVLPLTILIRPR